MIMMTNELNIVSATFLTGAFAAGLVLGAFYFIALWHTVQRLPYAPRPARLILISFVVRMAVILTAFYFLMDGHWERLAVAMIGFMVMKKVLTYHLSHQKAV
jgi:F1F0 ATPase subunit 2